MIGLFGLAVVLDTATGLGVVMLLGVLARSVALAEERYVEAGFGDEYRAYRSRVRRWIWIVPPLGRGPTSRVDRGACAWRS